jgi:hypothetical protein
MHTGIVKQPAAIRFISRTITMPFNYFCECQKLFLPLPAYCYVFTEIGYSVNWKSGILLPHHLGNELWWRSLFTVGTFCTYCLICPNKTTLPLTMILTALVSGDLESVLSREVPLAMSIKITVFWGWKVVLMFHVALLTIFRGTPVPWRWKHWYPFAKLYGGTSQKSVMFTLTVAKASMCSICFKCICI